MSKSKFPALWREPNILTNKPIRVKGYQLPHKPMTHLKLTQLQMGKAKIESPRKPRKGGASFFPLEFLAIPALGFLALEGFYALAASNSDTRDAASRIRAGAGGRPHPVNRQEPVAIVDYLDHVPGRRDVPRLADDGGLRPNRPPTARPR